MDRMILRHYSCGVIRRLLVFSLLALVCAPYTAAESVTVLVDGSFSMSLPHGSSTRMETLSQKLYEWIDAQPDSTRYALLVAEHQDTVDLRLPYPARGVHVKSEIAGTIPWGAIDLGRAIQNAARIAASIASSSEETGGRLVIVTDAEDMAAIMPARNIRLPAGLRYEVLRLDTTSPASVAGFIDGLQSLSDPELVTLGVTPAPSQAAQPVPEPKPAPEAPEASVTTPPPASVTTQHETSATTPPAPDGIVAAWARIGRWIFLAAALLGAVGVGKAVARHRRRVDAVRRHNDRPPRVPVEIRGPSGRARGEITSFPAGLSQSDLNLVHADLESAGTRVRMTCEDGKIILSADDTVKINGIGRTEHELTDRDQIRVGSIRVIVGEIERVKPRRLPRASHRFYALAPAAAAALAVVGFALAPAQPNSPTARTPTPAPTTTRSSGGPRPELSAGSLAISTSVVPELRLPTVIAPEDPLPDTDLDYLAIHAHPDDESLDFGASIARMHAAGLRGAVVLLTDGNAGLDQYPWRETGPDYPARDLVDEELASVRIAEAREAIGWLGAEYYIRLGLPNHPYGSLLEALPPQEILNRWGGRGEVAERIAELIRRLRPEIIISPDGPAQTLEHFEHEAAGLAVAAAVEAVSADAVSSDAVQPVRAHLLVVDPLQVELGDNPYRISAWTPSPDGSIPRLRQLLALRAHRTQRDATVIGVETRLALEHEYYHVNSLDQRFDLRQLFPEAARPLR